MTDFYRIYLSHIILAIKSASRGKMLPGVGVLFLLIAGLMWMGWQFSGRAPDTVAMDLGISGYRLIGVILVLFWAQELVGKDFEKRTLYVILTYPQARHTYILGRFFGIFSLILLTTLVFGFGMYLTLQLIHITEEFRQETALHFGLGYILTLLFIALDLSVLTAFIILMYSLSSTPILPLVLGLGFALATRGLGPALDVMARNPYGAAEEITYLNPYLNLAYHLFPDLSRLDIREVVLYGQWPSDSVLVFGFLMSLGYALLTLGLASWFFSKRDLN